MPRLTNKLPSYRLHKPSGRAVVTLNGTDYYLGGWNTPESRAEYDRRIGEWLAAGCGQSKKQDEIRPSDPTVGEVILAFCKHAATHYRGADGAPTQELENVKEALKPLKRLYVRTPSRSFGPLALRAVRDEMVKGGLARSTTNARINRIRRMFRWAASVELIPAQVVQALETVPGLQKGRTEAREPDPVKPVPIEHVEAVVSHLPRPVAAMVRLQLLTGCRAGEVRAMRGGDLVPGEPTWEYRPGAHKNAWRGQDRVIPLGPKAVAIVREFLKPDLAAHLFNPREAVETHHAERTKSRKTKPTPSELAKRVKPKPGSKHACHYDRRSYRQAIVRACGKAGVPTGSPLQLRHTAATLIRARYGLEAAQNVLGHAKPDTTLIYAERDLVKVREIAAEIG
jgi:integrase